MNITSREHFALPTTLAPFPGTRMLLMGGCLIALTACGGGGGGGGGTATGTTTPPPTPLPSVTLGADSTDLAPGESTTLTWSTTNADTCQASGGWSGSRATSGTATVGPLQNSTSFALSCSGSGGATLREVNITVSSDTSIDVNLTSTATSVRSGEQVELSWSATNADRCQASVSWTGDQPTQGSFTTPPITADSEYRLTCFAQGESAVTSLIVDVVDTTITWQAPTENVDGTPLTDLAQFRVYWGSSSRNYSDNVTLNGSERSWEMTMPAGTYYLAVTAIDGDNEESEFSNEIRRTLP